MMMWLLTMLLWATMINNKVYSQFFSFMCLIFCHFPLTHTVYNNTFCKTESCQSLKVNSKAFLFLFFTFIFQHSQFGITRQNNVVVERVQRRLESNSGQTASCSARAAPRSRHWVWSNDPSRLIRSVLAYVPRNRSAPLHNA